MGRCYSRVKRSGRPRTWTNLIGLSSRAPIKEKGHIMSNWCSKSRKDRPISILDNNFFEMLAFVEFPK